MPRTLGKGKDAEHDALLLVRELERGGYEAEFERVQAPEDMRRALVSGWDLILSDHRLPRLDSSQALKLAREGVRGRGLAGSGWRSDLLKERNVQALP